ncbi:MAG TPA: universal stress protein [Mariprofundaceae bacterium]|nr:universal stress protein [Mariprofundaceae bacterium]
MSDYKHILVPTDFSEPANQAVQTAAELARRFDAELHILHVMAPHMHYVETPEMMLPPLEDFTEEMRATSQRKLDELVTDAGTGIEVHAYLEESAEHAADVIVKFAGKLVADLIVVGSHGHTGLLHVLLGSTAERVVRESHCPVLVTKPTPEEQT